MYRRSTVLLYGMDTGQVKTLQNPGYTRSYTQRSPQVMINPNLTDCQHFLEKILRTHQRKLVGLLHFWIDLIGPMTSYVDLYQATLVGKIDCQEPCWINHGSWLQMLVTCHASLSVPTQTMSETSSHVGSSDATLMSCRHSNYLTCWLHVSKSNLYYI